LPTSSARAWMAAARTVRMTISSQARCAASAAGLTSGSRSCAAADSSLVWLLPLDEREARAVDRPPRAAAERQVAGRQIHFEQSNRVGARTHDGKQPARWVDCGADALLVHLADRLALTHPDQFAAARHPERLSETRGALITEHEEEARPAEHQVPGGGFKVAGERNPLQLRTLRR